MDDLSDQPFPRSCLALHQNGDIRGSDLSNGPVDIFKLSPQNIGRDIHFFLIGLINRHPIEAEVEGGSIL